jgi:transcriptional regulator with XRE-family HTH domain
LTQADVARRLGSSTLTVSRWELGVQAPQPHHREQLCRLYGVSAGELGLASEVVQANGSHAAAAPVPEWADFELEPAEERARRDLLTQVERYWFDAQLEAASDPLPSLELTLVERPGAVDDPRSVAARPSRAERELPRGAAIGDVYRSLGEQLLILGDPGAGKTTLLLRLGQELVARSRRHSSDPMPVVFHLASWAAERRPLARWLVDELHRRYGVSRRLGERWIQGEQVLPLLDGLDEVADRHRVACVAAINQFHGDHGQLPMVVCCRTAWYESLGSRLALRGAVVILPLSQAEVRRYLGEAGEEVAGVRALLAEDEQLRELLTTPLFLSIAAVAYRDRSAVASPEATLPERRRRLLGDYVDAMLSRASPTSPLPPQRTIGWLSWLARTMRAHDQSVFYLDWIQPSWLPRDAHPWLVTRGVTAAVGMASGLVVGLNWGLDWGVTLGPLMFALIGLTIGCIVSLAHGLVAHESRIVPAEQLRWSWAALRRGLPRWLGIGIAVGVLGGAVFGLALGLAIDVRPDVLSGPRSAGAAAPSASSVTLLGSLAAGAVSGLVTGMGLGLMMGLTFGLLTGLDKRYGVTAMAPGESVEASRRNAMVGGIVGGCVFGLGYEVFFVQGTTLTGPLVHQAAHALGLLGVYWPVAWLNDIVVAALMGAMVAGLQRGGGAYLRHRALLWILVRRGLAPRDYVAFLEYASRLVLLRRRGGGYEFIHRMLLEHFADLPFDGRRARPLGPRASSR